MHWVPEHLHRRLASKVGGGIFNDSPILTLKLHVNIKDVIMQKVVINALAICFLIISVVVLFSGCATTTSTDEEPFNVSKEVTGDTLWTSQFSLVSVKIDESFEFVGHEDKSNMKARRHYHVWKRDTGEILYIVDLQVRTTFNFPSDYDPNLGMDQNPNDPNLLQYKPMQYSIWKGIAKNSYRVLTGMGLTIPQCKAALQVAKLSPSRKAGVWVVLVQENQCGQYGDILFDGQDWITFQ
jgi:hypothetical protein